VNDLVIDSFAGGGGASTGIELALGRSPDYAINHDPEALAMHAANHPETEHLESSVWDVAPEKLCRGRGVELAWFSPDCKHFSKAKGGKPRDAGVRGLAWVVIRWANAVQPRVIFLENVEEFQDWGPLLADGTPDPSKRGATFGRWVRQLERAGYEVELRELRACDYGAPTSRKRLFVIARADGQRIAWPEPTHGPGRRYPHRVAAECMDWTLPNPSIFDRARPLAEATLRRIARGTMRYVVNATTPFVVPTDEGLVAPSLIQTSYGERVGQAPRVLDLHKPLGTVVAGGIKHALSCAFLAKHYSERQTGGWNGGASLELPFSAVTTRDHHGLVTTPFAPRANRAPEVRAFLMAYYGTEQRAGDLRLPLPTITTRDRFGLVTVEGVAREIGDLTLRMLAPRELFRAQGFPDRYRIDVGGLSKSDQVRMCGNSVAPPIAAALVAANVGERVRVERAA
jgi:DNA (cytosine-5)-methyltransferase 1